MLTALVNEIATLPEPFVLLSANPEQRVEPGETLCLQCGYDHAGGLRLAALLHAEQRQAGVNIEQWKKRALAAA